MGVEIRVRVELWFVSAGMSGLALGLKFGLDIILKLGLGFKFKDVYGVLQSIRMHQSKSRVIFYLGGGLFSKGVGNADFWGSASSFTILALEPFITSLHPAFWGQP